MPSKYHPPKVAKQYQRLVQWSERLLAAAVLAAIVLSAYSGAGKLAGMDWSLNETFYELINRVLLLVIGLELVRMLVSHHIVAVLELLAFVIARKMLKPDLSSLDILYSVSAFVLLMAVRRFMPKGADLQDKIDGQENETVQVKT